METITGIPVAPGAVIARAFVLEQPRQRIPTHHVGSEDRDEEMRQLEVERIGASDLLATEHLMLYMNLRSGNVGGAVVAKVERGSCQGCRITLPTRVLQLARTSSGTVQCPSCNRILYVS